MQKRRVPSKTEVFETGLQKPLRKQRNGLHENDTFYKMVRLILFEIDSDRKLDQATKAVVKKNCTAVKKMEKREMASGEIYPVLVGKDWMADHLSDSPYDLFLDLYIGYQFRRGDQVRILCYEDLKKLGVTAKEMMCRAFDNLMMQQPDLRLMAQMHDNLVEDIPMVIISNSETWYGAAMMLHPAALEAAQRVLQAKELYLLPASVHQIIAIPPTDLIDKQLLRQVVRSVNEELVLPQERLSDQVYRYQGDTHIYSIVTAQ